jgi:membrane fusion protein, multidrug efflux system
MRSFTKAGLVVIVVLLFASCKGEKSTDNANLPSENDSTARVFPVKVEILGKQKISRTLDYTANLQAFEEINYAPASPGRINKITVEIGDRIGKGQVLVEMDKTQLIQAQAQLENAKTSFQRVDTLHQLGSISEQVYDQTKTQYEMAKTSYEFLKQNTTLLSPINGIVTGKYFEDGELYSGAPNTAAGKAAVITIMQINPLKALVNISQSYFPDVKQGMKANITCDIVPGTNFSGNVSKVYPTIDAASRSFRAEVVINNAGEKLRPGMYARIEIALGEAEALVVPAITVLKQEGTNNRYIFINDNGTARQVDVEIGKRFDDQLEIIAAEDISGRELITEGQGSLLNGSKVDVIGR